MPRLKCYLRLSFKYIFQLFGALWHRSVCNIMLEMRIASETKKKKKINQISLVVRAQLVLVVVQLMNYNTPISFLSVLKLWQQSLFNHKVKLLSTNFAGFTRASTCTFLGVACHCNSVHVIVFPFVVPVQAPKLELPPSRASHIARHEHVAKM